MFGKVVVLLRKRFVVYTNSHKIDLDRFQYGNVAFPDRFSYREETKRRNGYILRIWWQFYETLELQDGVVFFDTLTYDDAHLPRISELTEIQSDRSCFNPNDYKRFIDYLRTLVDVPFKIFLSSEYGSSSQYVDYRGRLRVGTSRPHYHILFFIPRKVDTLDFATKVYKAWMRGKTDSFKPSKNGFILDRSKVLHNTFTKDNCDKLRRQKLANYLSKYCLKDAKFSASCRDLVSSYLRGSCNYGRDAVGRLAFKSDLRKTLNLIQPFIRISHGFGCAALQDADTLSRIWNFSEMRIPDKKTVWKTFSLPTFYKRKLFYQLKDGAWQLNDLGKKFYPRHLSHRASRLSSVFANVASNMHSDERSLLVDLMAGRSFQNLADYVVYYKGRIINPALIDGFPSQDDVCRRFIADSSASTTNDVVPNYRVYHGIFNRKRWFWADSFESEILSSEIVRVPVRYKLPEHTEDWHNYIIDDTWFLPHHDFDSCLDILNYYLACSGICTGDAGRCKQDIQLRLFNNGIKTTC